MNVDNIVDERAHPVLDGFAVGVWELSLADDKIVCSSEWQRMRMYDGENGLPDSFDQLLRLVHPDDRNAFQIHREELVSGRVDSRSLCYRVENSIGEFVRIEERAKALKDGTGNVYMLVGCDIAFPSDGKYTEHVLPDGSSKSTEFQTNKNVNEEGEHSGSFGAVSDIAALKEAEQALRESENRFSSLAATSPVAIFQFDASGMNCTYVNERWSEITGRPNNAALGVGWQDCLHPDDFSKTTELLKAFSSDSKTVSTALTDSRLVMLDGSIKWIHLRVAKELDEDGNVTGYIGTLSDISKAKQTERELRELNARLHKVLDCSSIGCWEWIADEQRLEWDQQMLQIHGITSDDFTGTYSDWSDRLHPEDFERVTNHDTRLPELGSSSKEFRIVRPNGEVRHIYATVYNEKGDDGQSFRTIGINVDTTELKEVKLANDVLAKATKTKDAFLANMSHELRTPLSAILAMNEGLQQGVFGETTFKQLESLKVVEQSGLHLLELINEVLDLAKIESGQLFLEPSSVDIGMLCQSSLSLVSPQAEKKDIQLNLNVPWNLPKLLVDEKRMRQVLLNLLSNAIKFTENGGNVRLEVQSVKGNSGDGQTLRISVHDDGIGIREDHLSTLFDPFVQVDSSLSRNYEGTGLGLSLAKQFVELHNGTISVQSEEGKGSCFAVELPFKEPPATDILRIDPKSDEATPKMNFVKDPLCDDDQDAKLILLAEDNEHVVLAVSQYLEATGYRVVHAVNGKIAVELARKRLPNLILMDIQMPVMDGLEAMRQIRATPDLVKTPIIAMSGFTMPEDTKRCLDAGANLFVSKPCPMKDLVSAILKLLTLQTAKQIKT